MYITCDCPLKSAIPISILFPVGVTAFTVPLGILTYTFPIGVLLVVPFPAVKDTQSPNSYTPAPPNGVCILVPVWNAKYSILNVALSNSTVRVLLCLISNNNAFKYPPLCSIDWTSWVRVEFDKANPSPR